MKKFSPFFLSRPDLVSKWSSGVLYIADLSRKQQKKHSKTLKMDQEKAFFQSYMYRAFGRMVHKVPNSDFIGGRKGWPKIAVPSLKRGRCRGV
jgi:hypothetical protein